MIYRFGKLTWKNFVFDRNNTTLLDLFQKRVKKEPNKICFYFEDKVWTVKQVSAIFHLLIFLMKTSLGGLSKNVVGIELD